MKKLMYILAGIILVSVPTAACTNAPAAVEGAEALGLTNVQTQGHSFFGCAESDSTATKFTAANAQGRRVKGIACGGIGPFAKGTTIRIVGFE